ncbi:unnamed protein product [Clonostachys rosea]|uniref:Uncharacterized protein n=1 Tax=Bionectria ochroleuca TaxID=29856 RepID=A0ABY6UFG7_BIOOC|nr:unnamed protein product [Clonostachys rosea]
MCYQVIELYSACKCLYYKHAVDWCMAYGRPGHYTEQRTVYVNYACAHHSQSQSDVLQTGVETSGVAVGSRGHTSLRDAPISVPRSIPGTAMVPNDIPTEVASNSHGKENDNPFKSRTVSGPDAVVETNAMATDSDVLEDLVRDLLVHNNLRYLWPQIVELAGDHAWVVLKGFMEEFAQDLEMKASTKREIYTSRYVLRRASDLATRIVQVHLTSSLNNMSSTDETHIEETAGLAGLDYPEYRSIHRLMFEISPNSNANQEPIRKLENNLREVVLHAHPSVSKGTRTFQSIGNFCDSLSEFFTSSFKLEPSSTIVRHQCHCGRIVSDKYVELSHGSLDRFRAELEGYGKSQNAVQDQDSVPVSTTAVFKIATGALSGLWKQMRHHKNASTDRLPSHHSGGIVLEQFGCPPQPQRSLGDHTYLLLCLPFMRLAVKLRQDEVCRLNSDREFFSFLRSCYEAARQRRAWPWMRRVSTIDFTRFEVFENSLVNVQLKPSLPTGQYLQQYNFEPLEADIIPPIGPNLMMHYFEHPDHADVVPVLFRRIPKKLHEKLSACPVKKSSVGWGMHLVEGADTFLIFCFGLGAFAIALVVALAWSIIKSDVQGGFAISVFVLSLLLFIGNAGRTIMV